MNVLMQTPHRPGRRLAELDPFDLDPSVQGATELKRQAEPEEEAAADYGCVDWYAYGALRTTRENSAAPPRFLPPGDASRH